MGSCANGGGYYHYSYSVVRGCDRKLFYLSVSLWEILTCICNSKKESSPLISMFPDAPLHLKPFCTGCFSFSEKCVEIERAWYGENSSAQYGSAWIITTSGFRFPGIAIDKNHTLHCLSIVVATYYANRSFVYRIPREGSTFGESVFQLGNRS